MRINPTDILRQSTILTLLAILVTITTWSTDPRVTWGYEMGVFFLAGWACLQPGANLKRWPPALWAALGIGLFGFFQLAVGTTVYRWATLQAALSNLALAASALAAYLVFAKGSVRAAFLGSFRGFGLILSVISVLSYWTSPGKILWIFPAIYPDNWGPFPSRNNFAQFLELSFPVALWEMGRRRREGQPREEAGGWTAAVAPAVMLGAGLASASRAGAALLVAEGAAGLLLLRRRKGALRKPALTLALASTVFASVAGAGVLLRRFEDRDPLRIRREIFHSTAAMLEALPVRLKAQPSRLEAQPSRWSGYGLGTFASVYPQFAEFG